MNIVHMLVEGTLDEAVAVRLLLATGHMPGECYGKRGYGYIKAKLSGFNQVARSAHFLTLVDFMDTGLSCPSEVLAQWLPHRHPNMMFHLVKREVESWLLADREGMANYLKIHAGNMPPKPEELQDPKRSLINLARRSKSSYIRSALVPEPRSTAQVGRLYESEMTRFIQSEWNPEEAGRNAPSLQRCLFRLEEAQKEAKNAS